MIKIEHNQEIESILIKDTVWDLKRKQKHVIRFFGLKLWSWTEDHIMSIDRNEDKLGFQNGRK
jgi:hypothetical protein